MRRKTIVPGMLAAALAGLVLAASAAPAAAVTQSELESAGWTCIQPLPVTDEPHCIRPHRLALMFSGEARSTTFLVFDLEGRFLGAEVNLAGGDAPEQWAVPMRSSFLELHPDQENRRTFNGWRGDKEGTAMIDHILVSKAWTVKKAWIEYHHQDGIWPSDHYPVAAVVELAE